MADCDYDPDRTAKLIELSRKNARCVDIKNKIKHLQMSIEVGEYNPYPGRPTWEYPIIMRHMTRNIRLKFLKFEYAYKCVELDF
ncbi:Hypothetical protein PACV_57 [Pacmanvirus A23]|uniref:Hypothetical protein n=1 Tax=Pacmanvirus A23 TaxID=1932881 RepID=UPI000A094385|nr:Hypothetical protein B9W72_gp057 [Pacmanvirus A23]SIP85774.1 Hypothetical protein PACV_57 [Pacmanvirus A23]